MHLQSTRSLISHAKILQLTKAFRLYESVEKIVVQVKRAEVWEWGNVQAPQSVAASSKDP